MTFLFGGPLSASGRIGSALQKLLNKQEVEYMVVGGYALAFHGEPRFTGDLDIWIDCTELNAEKMVRVMQDFGAASIGFTKSDFLNQGIIKQIGQPPLRIDILGEIEGVQYADAVKDKQEFQSQGLKIPYIGAKDFIRNREALGRKKDKKDAKKLKPKLNEKKKSNPKGSGKGRKRK